MKNSIFRKIFAAMSLCAVFGANAEIMPTALPTDSRMVVVKYNASQIINLLTAPGYTTHIEFEKGETLELPPAFGDSFQWEQENQGNHLFIKPDKPNITTNMTVVTNKRSYHFQLTSSPEGGIYYQYVQFKYQKSGKTEMKLAQVAEPSVEEKPAVRTKEPEISAADITAMSTYSISGEAPFKPEFVVSNGKFTYFKFPSNIKELPVIYVKEGGEYHVVNQTYKPESGFITISKVADHYLLAIEDQKVEVNKGKKGWWQ